MSITIIISLGFGLVVILALLLGLFFQKPKVLQNTPSPKKTKSLEDLLKVLKDKTTSAKELESTLSFILTHYGIIDDFDMYTEILVRITKHPHTNKKIILSFDKELSRLNPQYKKEISKTITYSL